MNSYLIKKLKNRRAAASGGASAQTWVYYYDGQTIKRRKITDTAGSEIETVSSNSTAIFNGLMGGIGFDFSLGSAGTLCVGLTAATAHLYEIDLSDDSETNLIVGGDDWHYDVLAQPDVGGGRWIYGDQGTIHKQDYGGGNRSSLSAIGDWVAEDADNDYLLTAKESSGGVRRYTSRTTPTTPSTVHSGITARAISCDVANGNVYYGDRTANKLWKTQYHPTIGTPVELDSYGPDGIGAVDYVAEDDKLYYAVVEDVYSMDPDGSNKTLLFTLSGTLGQNSWGAKFIHTT